MSTASVTLTGFVSTRSGRRHMASLALGAVVMGCSTSTVAALKLQSVAPWFRCLESFKVPLTEAEIEENKRRKVRRAKKYVAMVNFLAHEMLYPRFNGSNKDKEDAILVSNYDQLRKLVNRKLVSNRSDNPESWVHNKAWVMEQKLATKYLDFDKHALGHLFELLERSVNMRSGKIDVGEAFPRAIRDYYNYWLKKNNMNSRELTERKMNYMNSRKLTEERINELWSSWNQVLPKETYFFALQVTNYYAEVKNELANFLEPNIRSFAAEFTQELHSLGTSKDRSSYELGLAYDDTRLPLIAKDLARGVFDDDVAYVNQTLGELRSIIEEQLRITVYHYFSVIDDNLPWMLLDDYDYSVLGMKILCDQIISIQNQEVYDEVYSTRLSLAISMIENHAFLVHINQNFLHSKARDTDLWGEDDVNENLLNTRIF